MMKKFLTLTVLGAFLMASCSSDDDNNNNPNPSSTTNFRITLTSTINYLNTTVFNTPDGEAGPGPLAQQGQSYTFSFEAFPGSSLSFVSMLANSNDWFFAPTEAGIALFDDEGNAITGDVTDQIYVWDAGTEEEDPATIATVEGGAEAGDPDDDNTVRLLPDLMASDYLSVTLEHDGNSQFTVTITKETAEVGEGVVTPGVAVVHAQSAPFFTQGEADRGLGLEAIAEAGVPTDLNAWFNEVGSDGAPLRLSSSHTPFSPALVYAFSGATDPLFVQGESVTSVSGLEAIAEDGDTETAYNYLVGQGLSVDRGDGLLLPGAENSVTLEIEAQVGDKLGFATMFVQSNDWFLAFNNNGVDLFDNSGNPVSGTDATIQAYVYDAGTEADEDVGFGVNQAPRQAAPNTGDADANTTIRRVGEITDLQFGKGMITSAAGVAGYGDPRGGYNLIQITIEPIN